MKNITHILHFPAFEFYIPDRIMQTVQQERGMDMKQIFVSSTLLWNAGLEEMFQRVYDNGFDGIELWAQQFFARGYDTQEYPFNVCNFANAFTMASCIASAQSASL